MNLWNFTHVFLQLVIFMFLSICIWILRKKKSRSNVILKFLMMVYWYYYDIFYLDIIHWLLSKILKITKVWKLNKLKNSKICYVSEAGCLFPQVSRCLQCCPSEDANHHQWDIKLYCFIRNTEPIPIVL